MEITKKAKFITDFYGGKAYLSGDKIVKNWLESQQDRLLNPRYRELKDAMGNESKLEDILSVFNIGGSNEPVIGNWMIMECSRNAAKLANTWGKFQVSAPKWQGSVLFSPASIQLHRNGKQIKDPDSVECYTISLKDRSFFKAYQAISQGAWFKFTINFPEDLCEKPEGRGKNKIFVADEGKTLDCINAVLDKMCIVGLGAYRLRFGKFEYV